MESSYFTPFHAVLNTGQVYQQRPLGFGTCLEVAHGVIVMAAEVLSWGILVHADVGIQGMRGMVRGWSPY